MIYAHPPWRFDTFSAKGKGRTADAHCDCLSIDDIRALPVAKWAMLKALPLM